MVMACFLEGGKDSRENWSGCGDESVVFVYDDAPIVVKLNKAVG
jgi:hypothetical protein